MKPITRNVAVSTFGLLLAFAAWRSSEAFGGDKPQTATTGPSTALVLENEDLRAKLAKVAGTDPKDPSYAGSVAGLKAALADLKSQNLDLIKKCGDLKKDLDAEKGIVADRDAKIKTIRDHVVTVHFQEQSNGGRQKDSRIKVGDLLDGKKLDCGDPAGSPFDNNDHICRTVTLK